MNKLDKYKQKLKKLEESDSYWAHGVIEQFVAELERCMNAREINKAQFAKRASVSPSYVTKVMNGNANLSIESMAKLARVVDGVVHVHIAPRGVAGDWVDHYGSSLSGETTFARDQEKQKSEVTRRIQVKQIDSTSLTSTTSI